MERLESWGMIPIALTASRHGHAVEALGGVSLYDGLDALHNHIQDIREEIIEYLTAASDKANLN